MWVGQHKVHTPNGSKTKYTYSKNRKDAAAKLVKAIVDRDAGFVFDSESLTVKQYLNRWLDAIRGTVRERTWKRSEEIVRLHLVPSLGKTRLDRLSSFQLQSLYSTKLDSGLSARTVRDGVW